MWVCHVARRVLISIGGKMIRPRWRRRPGVVPLFSLLAAVGCGDSPVTTNDPVATEIVSGDEQNRLPSTVLVEDLTLRAVDASGGPVRASGLLVTWTVTLGGGVLETADAITDADGEARAQWKLGSELGDQAVVATVEGTSSVTFAARSVEAGPIVFSSNRLLTAADNGAYNLYAMNADGTDVVRLTNNIQPTGFFVLDIQDRHPTWSPDGSMILFSRRDSTGLRQARLLDMLTLEDSPLPIDILGGQLFDWSPSGELIVGIDRLSGACGIWTMEPDGAEKTPRGPSICEVNAPDWSPDGSLIAFESEEGLSCPDGSGTCPFAIWTMEPDGTNRTRVSEAQARYPQWLPDGQHIVYGSRPYPRGSTEATISLLDLESGESTVVWVPDGSPAWAFPGDVSPDGRYVIIEVLRPFLVEVYVLDLDTKQASILTNFPDSDKDPAWRR